MKRNLTKKYIHSNSDSMAKYTAIVKNLDIVGQSNPEIPKQRIIEYPTLKDALKSAYRKASAYSNLKAVLDIEIRVDGTLIGIVRYDYTQKISPITKIECRSGIMYISAGSQYGSHGYTLTSTGNADQVDNVMIYRKYKFPKSAKSVPKPKEKKAPVKYVPKSGIFEIKEIEYRPMYDKDYKKKISKTFDNLDKARAYAYSKSSGYQYVMRYVIVPILEVKNGTHKQIGRVVMDNQYAYGGSTGIMWWPPGAGESDRVNGVSASGRLNKTIYRLT